MKKLMLMFSYFIISAFVLFMFKYGIENQKDSFIYISLIGGGVLFVFVYLMFNIKVKNFEIDLDDKSLSVNREDKKEVQKE